MKKLLIETVNEILVHVFEIIQHEGKKEKITDQEFGDSS